MTNIFHVAQGTALATIIASVIECLDLYVDSMQKSVDERSLNAEKPYFDVSELMAVHDGTKAQAFAHV